MSDSAGFCCAGVVLMEGVPPANSADDGGAGAGRAGARGGSARAEAAVAGRGRDGRGRGLRLAIRVGW